MILLYSLDDKAKMEAQVTVWVGTININTIQRRSVRINHTLADGKGLENRGMLRMVEI